MQNVALFDEAVSERCDELENEAQKLERLIECIYELENDCYKAHSALQELGEQFERLENFAPNTPLLPLRPNVIIGVMYVPPKSICERISHYKCEPSNFDLAGFDEGGRAQIDTLRSFITEQRELVSTKCAFLKALADEQRQENGGEKADFAKFSKPQQSLFLQLAALAECLQSLINASFVEFENGSPQRYKNAQKLIDELYKDTPRSLEMQDLDELKEDSAALVSKSQKKARTFETKARGEKSGESGEKPSED